MSAVAIKQTRHRCKRCGGNIWDKDEDGYFCILCGLRYHSQAEYGRKGGQKTVSLYGREYMSKLGKLGGRPKSRQLPAPEVQSQLKGGTRLPNSLKELKGLYLQIKGGEATPV